MKKQTLALISTVAALTVVNNAQADFGVTFRTTASDSVDTAANRLYNAPGVAPQLTDPFWFAIQGSTPMPINSGATTFYFDPADGMAGIVAALFGPDAFVAQRTVGNGTTAFLPSRNTQTISGIPSHFQSGGTGANDAGGIINPAYAVLFDDANLLDGATFNFDLTVASGAIPQFGSPPSLRIGQDIISQGFQLVAVPEPAIGAYVAGALGLLALIRRRLGQAC